MAATQALPAYDGDQMPFDAAWTEDQVLAALYQRLSSDGWFCVGQVTTHDDEGITGDTATHRRIDMLCFRRDRDTRTTFETLAIEVKVNRTDFLNDIRDPHKQALWRESATRHAYAAPPGIIAAGEVPADSGYLEVERLVPTRPDSRTSVNWVRRAPRISRQIAALPLSTHLSLLARLAKAEADAKGWGDVALQGDERALRQKVKFLERALDRAERAADTERGKAIAWQTAYASAAPDGLPCRWCGRGLRPLRPGKTGFSSWRHIDKTDDAPCAVMEEADRLSAATRAYWAAPEPERERKLRERMAAWQFRERFDYDAEPWRAFYDHVARKPEPDTR